MARSRKHRSPKPSPLGSPSRLAKSAPSVLDRCASLVLVAAIVVVSAFLLLWNLGDQRLWQDEANTALVSHLVVSYLLLCELSIAPYFRYLGPMIPVFYLLIAVMLEGLTAIHPLVFPVAVVLVILGGNITSYFYEITHAFNGPIKGITSYLNQHGKPSDIVAVTYGDLPIKFYTNMRVVGGLAGDDLSVAKNADWIILRKHVVCVKDLEVANYLRRNVNWANYVPVPIDAPDTLFENREDPALHLFRSKTTEDKVVIWKKTSD